MPCAGFPVEPSANMARSNLHYGRVTGQPDWSDGGSKKGENMAGQTVFEPRDIHKGDAARARFYFAVIYDFDIPPNEEQALRQWHQMDPPSARERQRNTAIEKVQQSRNRFIDYPSLVGQISDF